MHKQTAKLIFPALGTGVLTLGLRLHMYKVGFDHKNILSSYHPLHLICLGTAVLMALYLALAVRKLDGNTHPRRNFPAHPLRDLAIVAAGCLMAVHGIALFREAAAILPRIRAGLALAAAGAMLLSPFLPKKNLGLQSLLHGIITVFFAVDMLCRYRDWSGNPQLPDYVFQIFGCIGLCLCSYHRLAFDVELGKRRMLLWCSMMGLHLCIACVSGPETEIFFLGGALWAGSCLCTPKPPVEFLKAADDPAGEEQGEKSL